MHTDFKDIKSFDVAVISMIAAGFIIIGVTLFATLTPRQQVNVVNAIQIFDIHEQAAATTEDIKFVFSLPGNFYEEFYIAFTEVAVLPSETFEIPYEIAKEFSRNIKVAISNLSDQAALGYEAQRNFHNVNSGIALLPHDGVVMGAMIDISEKINTVVIREPANLTSLDMQYGYEPPTVDDAKLFFKSLIP